MKIEISEVFVTRTDAITLDQIPAPVGIAALETRVAPLGTNIKCRPVRLRTTFYGFLSLKLKDVMGATEPSKT
jgi:hypothetical protein